MLEIKFAKLLDTDNIMKFIHNHWKNNHILSIDKDLFLYEYQDKDMINFVIATDYKNNIYGILGFIKSSNNNSDIWAAMWKAIKHDNHPMLGVELLEYLRNSSKYNKLTCSGINTNVIPIYNYLGFYTDYLHQYVMINTNLKNFNILKIKDAIYSRKLNFIENTKYSLTEIEENQLNFNFKNDNNSVPCKGKKYFVKRYYNHPIFKYTVFGIFKEEAISSVIVTREVVVGNSKVLRIMDYLGNENDIVYISKYLYRIVIDNDYEYIDFMCYGFNNDNLERACFTKINLESNDLIVPNYFSPFLQENIKINFMADTKEIDKLRICKADGDQDRPN